MLFIVAGAFSGLDDIIAARARKRVVGFGAPLLDSVDEGDLFAEVRPEDLQKYGLIPEFIGRLPVVAAVSPLDQDALVRILTEPKNALVKQYQRMFQIDGVELEFDDEAVAADRRPGAAARHRCPWPARHHGGGPPAGDVRGAQPRRRRRASSSRATWCSRTSTRR